MKRRIALKAIGLGLAASVGLGSQLLGSTVYSYIPWLIGIGDSITAGVYGLNGGYGRLTAAALHRWYGRFAIAGSRTDNLLYQSARAGRLLRRPQFRESGIVVCTSGINDIRFCDPTQVEVRLSVALVNLQAVADYWAIQKPGTVTIILPPVENGSGVQGMSRMVTDAYLNILVYPAVALDWYLGGHDYGTIESWWHDGVHPNEAGHQSMAETVIKSLGNIC